MRLNRFLAYVLILGISAANALAQDKKVPPDAQKAIDAVRAYIDKLERGKGVGELSWKGDESVRKTLSDYHIVNARFRIFPVARQVPEGLNTSSIFAVNKDGKVEFIKDVKALEKFVASHGLPASSQETAKTALSAWLNLSQEFHQDGFYKFEVIEKEFSHDAVDKKVRVEGRAMVTQGGNGELRAILRFEDGKLAKVEEKAALRPGPRPICQATKLLDPDPIVHRMAEQDLLIMGLSARDYLLSQREKAAPELQRAIDDLWQRIEKNGW